MVSLHEGPEERVPHHRSFVEAASRARVAQIVYLSFLNAGPDAVFVHARSHGETELMLRESGVSWTSIRNGMYADHVPGWFDAQLAGELDVVSDDYRLLTGRAPRTIRKVIERHLDEMPLRG